MNGVWMHYLLLVVLWSAAILQFAVIRDKTLVESQFSESGRALLAAGLAGLALRFSYLIFDKGTLGIPMHSVISLLLIALGAFIVALGRIITGPGMNWTKPPAPWFTTPGEFDSHPHDHLRRTGDASR